MASAVLPLPPAESTSFGSGWTSGVLSSTLGAIGLGAVFCFQFPWLLTVPELRELYPLPHIRALLHLVLVGSFVLGVLSVCLRRNQDSRRHWHRVDARGLGGLQVPVDGD